MRIIIFNLEIVSRFFCRPSKSRAMCIYRIYVYVYVYIYAYTYMHSCMCTYIYI